MPQINCFKAYDVRGKVPGQLNEEIAWLIGRAYVEFLDPRQVAVGRDIRLSSPAISEALIRGIMTVRWLKVNAARQLILPHQIKQFRRKINPIGFNAKSALDRLKL